MPEDYIPYSSLCIIVSKKESRVKKKITACQELLSAAREKTETKRWDIVTKIKQEAYLW